MKKTILSLVATLSFSCLAETLEINEIIAYRGTLANRNVFITLSRTEDRILGSYFYTRYKTPIALHGSFSGSKLFLIEETNNGEAHIDAEIKGGTISGTWKLKERTHEIHAQPLSKPYETIIEKINISEQGSTSKTLSITFKNGTNQSLDISTLEKSTLIIFEDFTFNGYPDMRILELEAGGNSSFIYFEYDVATEKYVASSSEIRNLINPNIIHNEKIITSVSKDGCCTYHANKIMPNEIHTVIYDYESKTGHATIINKKTGQETRKSINAEYFEGNYLNFAASRTKN